MEMKIKQPEEEAEDRDGEEGEDFTDSKECLPKQHSNNSSSVESIMWNNEPEDSIADVVSYGHLLWNNPRFVWFLLSYIVTNLGRACMGVFFCMMDGEMDGSRMIFCLV
jgi:hypothetical protein